MEEHMSEAAAEATQDGNEGGRTSTATDFEPITSQEDLDRVIGKRIERERAKFTDYDDLKSKASQFDALSEASKTEQEKLMERIAKLESDISKKELAASIADVAREFKLTEKQAAALKYAPSTEAAREIAEGLAADRSDLKKQGNVSPREGTNPRPSATDERSAVRDLFGQAG